MQTIYTCAHLHRHAHGQTQLGFIPILESIFCFKHFALTSHVSCYFLRRVRDLHGDAAEGVKLMLECFGIINVHADNDSLKGRQRLALMA